MQAQRTGFVTPVRFSVSSQGIGRRVFLCRRASGIRSRVACVARVPQTPSQVKPSVPEQQPSKGVNAQECINAFLKQLRHTHIALQGPRPPDPASVERLLSAFKDVCLEIQANLERSLPGMSHLDLAISAATEEATTPRELARLLKPTGPLRTLCGAAIAALSQARVSVDVSPVDGDTPASLRAARAVVIRHASLRLRGPALLRNTAWRGLSWGAMRAHPSVIELPETATLHLNSPEQLRMLRQDGKAFARSRDLFPLRSDTVWQVLGFGEDEAVARLGDGLPNGCRGHRHALEGWQAFFGDAGGKPDTFAEQYHTSHVPNAVLSYLAAAKEKFDREFEGRARWSSPVKMRETGLAVAELKSSETIAASPVGRLLRRRKDDFWGWAKLEDVLLLVHTEMVFAGEGTGCDFGVVKPREKLDVISLLEAQVSMLVCGEQFRRADVVWHGMLGGTKTFRVERDDRLLELVERGVESFCERFVWDKARPPERGFQAGDEFDELGERIREGCEKVQCVYDARADVDEMRVEEWRESMKDWERRKSEMPFLREKREKVRST